MARGAERLSGGPGTWAVALLAVWLVTGPTAATAVPVSCDPSREVEFGGHCYYLDGSGGVCDANYVLASQSVLGEIAAEFAGKTYKHQVSDNCCIYNSDPVEDWGMTDPPSGHCNQPGPFSAGEPSLGGAACSGDTSLEPNQLTLCVSLFTLSHSVPALSELGGSTLALLLVGTGVVLLRRSGSPGAHSHSRLSRVQ